VQRLRRDKRAASPAISTVILTAAVVVMILVAMSFANNTLDVRLAENEFAATRQFMLTTGLQIDDISWTVGRTQTVQYSSKFGTMKFQPSVVRYAFEVDYDADGAGFVPVFSNLTGMIMFNLPITAYNLGNDYFERLSPSSNGSFLQRGSTAPVSHVFCVEKLPMADGSYSRIVVVPSIRMLNSTIDGPQQQDVTYYFKFYLPTLEAGTHLYRSQSITLNGYSVTKIVRSGVNQVRITATFPEEALGLSSDFYKFDHPSETLSLPAGSVVEFYIGKILVSLGSA
jgi:hypothetical protein